MDDPILPDILAAGLRVIFCGTAAGKVSAKKRAYYAGPGNRFWPTLYEIKLTPRRLEPVEFPKALEFGIGLTDVAKAVSGADSDLPRHGFDAESLRRKITQWAPEALAFNGKRAAKEFFGGSVSYGRQSERVGSTVVFVLPSTSGAARRYWDISYWHELAEFVLGSRFSCRAEPDNAGRF
jgi:TDG/mug DNA glycosylase family protein